MAQAHTGLRHRFITLYIQNIKSKGGKPDIFPAIYYPRNQ